MDDKSALLPPNIPGVSDANGNPIIKPNANTDPGFASPGGSSPTPTPTPTLDPIIQGLTQSLVDQFGLKDVYQAYLAKDFSKAEQLWLTSNAYKNIGSAVIANAEIKQTQPGVYDKKIAQEWLPALNQYAVDSGLKITPENLKAIAEKAFGLGLAINSQAVKDMFKTSLDATGNVVPNPYISGIAGGVASTTKQNLATANADYGAGFNQNWIDAAAESVATGATTEQYWTDKLKTQAIGAFPAWADQINNGMTMKQIASPYINAYSNILGIDPASVTLSDNLLKQGLQGTDPTKPGAMPLWEFEKQVRQDPRWATSKDAMDSLSSTGSTILKQWGLMS
jgi:hypothetical protein